MSKLRVYKASLTALPLYKLRIYKASLTAVVPVVTKVRVYKASLTAVGAVVVTVDPTRLAGPGEPVALTASLLTGGTPTWAWRRISGPSIGLTVVGNVASFVAPSLWNADYTQPTGGVPGISTLVIGVRATVDGVQSAEVRCEVSILPQLSWSGTPPNLVGSKYAPA